MIDDYEQVVRRAFDEPYLDELRALVRVCGDHFESHGDPRGALISLGEARYDATGKRVHELDVAIRDHLLAYYGADLSASIELVRSQPCELDFRCGLLYGARVDLRRVGRANIADALDGFLSARISATLRRLAVRVPQDNDVRRIVAVIGTHEHALEELYILREVRPRRMPGWGGAAVMFGGKFERLYVYGEGDAIYPLLPSNIPTDYARLVALIDALPAPLDADAHTLLGRALTSPDAAVREAACKRLGRAGEAAARFVDLLTVLLQPGLVTPLIPILDCLRHIGRPAWRAVPVLKKIPGRASHYDKETRSFVGSMLPHMR